MKNFCLLFCLSIAMLASAARGGAGEVKLELKDADRVAFVGDTFVEREQNDCYIETMLTSQFPDRNITFRNLGYSADTVTGSARGLCTGWATYEATDKAFDRLRKLVADFKPTVLLMNYGMTESFTGPDGIPQFVSNYNKMLDALSAAAGTSPRIVLMSPNYHEDLGKPLPDPTEHNKNLKLYSDAIAAIAKQRSAVFIDLFTVTKFGPADAERISSLTSNGIHLTPYGYWISARKIALQLNYPGAAWNAAIDASGKVADAKGAEVTLVKAENGKLEFTITNRTLPRAPSPIDARTPSTEAVTVSGSETGNLTITGLKNSSRYSLSAITPTDKRAAVTATGAQWALGVKLAGGPDVTQTETLRKLIIAKNFDFFNYQRPDNDAYILAFRHAEQGRHAPEISNFLPLVEEKEKQIAELRVPKPVTYTLEAVK